jgi:hypothetical protein
MYSESGSILIISNFYPPNVVGGAEIVAANLACWLAMSGRRVTVVSTCDRAIGRSDTIESGVRVIRYFPPNLWWNFDCFKPGDRRTAFGRLAWNVRDAWNRQSARLFGNLGGAAQTWHPHRPYAS